MSSQQIVKWVGLASKGDTSAFELLVQAFQRPVCAIAYSVMGDRAASEDVAQEAFIAAWKGLPALRSPERFSSWLFAITRNLANGAVRQGVRERRATSVRVDDDAVPGPDVSVAAEDSADAVWDSLEGLPQRYREVMVLYYREGESAAAVAAALGLSEECVRQRLARGRNMLRDRVAHLVEEVLRTGGPSRAFTTGVIAGLTLSGAQLTMAQTTFAAAVGGKAAAAAGPGALFGSLAVLAGPLVGLTGGFFGMWASIRNAPTLAARRYVLRVCACTYGGVWLFLGYLFACMSLGENHELGVLSPAVAGWILYGPALAGFILYTNGRMHRIVLAASGEEEPCERDRRLVASCTMKRAWRTFFFAMPIAFVGSLGLVWVAHSLAGAAWVIAVLVLILCHGGFAVLFRAGARLSANAVAFEATAPARGATDWIAASATPRQLSTRIQFWNDVGALAGAIIGGTCWLFFLCMNAGEQRLGIGFAIAVLLLFAATLTVRYFAGRRHVVFLWSLMLTGALTGATVRHGWPSFVTPGIDLPMGAGGVAALMLCALWVGIAVSVYGATRPVLPADRGRQR